MASNFKTNKFSHPSLAGALLIFTLYAFTCFDETYPSHRIGHHSWMGENLRSTCFRNGDSIPLVKSKEEWVNYCKLKKPARCYHLFDSDKIWMGSIYNYYAIRDARDLAPKGWRMPMNSDWWDIEDVLGPKCGTALKSDRHWVYPGTNSVSFDAYPTGCLAASVMEENKVDIRFSGLDTLAIFWSADTTTRDLRCSMKDGGVSISRDRIAGWYYILVYDKLVCLPVAPAAPGDVIYSGFYVRCVESEEAK